MRGGGLGVLSGDLAELHISGPFHLVDAFIWCLYAASHSHASRCCLLGHIVLFFSPNIYNLTAPEFLVCCSRCGLSALTSFLAPFCRRRGGSILRDPHAQHASCLLHLQATVDLPDSLMGLPSVRWKSRQCLSMVWDDTPSSKRVCFHSCVCNGSLSPLLMRCFVIEDYCKR